jgi:hypothetical protein
MNATNMKMNGEWCKHARRWIKKQTAKKRRQNDKKVIRFFE